MQNQLYAFVYSVLTLKFIRPRMRIPAFLLAGVVCGMALLLAHVSRATSYLFDSPKTCMNCHVMTDAYISWQHSSHGRDVTCNDCHVPHTSIPREYAYKACDGLKHAAVFTLRAEPQAIKLSNMAAPVVQENCLRCHEPRVSETTCGRHASSGEFRCWDCHREVAHGRVHSLSASPDAYRPQLPPVVPGTKKK